jgi:predicted PolB exonuclease-like 3'-5' exonuclease
MPRSYLVLDIETVPDAELYVAPELPPAGPGAHQADRPFPPLFAHRPVVLGVLWLDERYRLKRLGVIGDGKDEQHLLADFSDFVGKHHPELVTYNGRSFDLPVLALRALRHGVSMPWYYQGRLRHRYSEDGHLDLCDMLSDHGAARSMSLDAMARLIGLPGKIGVDGSQVEGMFKAGQLDLIKNYCLTDVAQTALLFLRFRLLQGAIGSEQYREAAAELMTALRADGRLGELMDAVDGERLLGAAAAASTRR